MSQLRRVIISATTVCALAVTLPMGVAAKAQKKSPSRSVTGCLQKGDEPNTYKLTNLQGRGAKTAEIVETASGVDLAAHVGHKVTVTGTTVSAPAAAKAEGAKNTKAERGETHFRADAVKMISATCP